MTMSKIPDRKIVCLGFQKTGTTSFGIALRQLGYRVSDYNNFRDLADADVNQVGDLIRKRAPELLARHDVFKDSPWPVLYREIDKLCENAKFILITRDTEKWIRSVTRDFGSHHNSIREYIYGVGYPQGNEATFVSRYEQHNADVLAYFESRPDDFLHLHLDDGGVNWATICPFIGASVPNLPWPHANTHREKKFRMLLGRLGRRLGL